MNDDGEEIFDQFIPSQKNMMNHSHDSVCCTNINALGQQDRALQEMGTSLQQLPTPDVNVDEVSGGGSQGPGNAGGGVGGGYWNGSDTLSSMSMSDFLPENWPQPADNELMLRLLWDGYAMSFDDSALGHSSAQDGMRNTAV